MLCVLPGVFEVLAKPFFCKSELRSDDFPTLERPRKEISGFASLVQCSRENALLINSAEVIFIKAAKFKLDHKEISEKSLTAG